MSLVQLNSSVPATSKEPKVSSRGILLVISPSRPVFTAKHGLKDLSIMFRGPRSAIAGLGKAPRRSL